MIHLFKKVYIASDALIDLDMDRIIISDEYGIQLGIAYSQLHSGILHHAVKSVSELIGQDKAFHTWVRFFNFLLTQSMESDKRLIIYCDDVSFMTIATAWFKVSLPNATKATVRGLIESFIFRDNAFYRSRRSSNQGRTDIVYTIDDSTFDATYDEINASHYTTFMDTIKPYVGVEFILATYLTSGYMKDELKQILSTLIRKDLEIVLYEIKELFMIHFTTERFAVGFGLDKEYNINNIKDIVSDQSPFARLFFDPRLWENDFINTGSSSQENIRFENFTQDDITAIKDFVKALLRFWPEDGQQFGPKTSLDKLDFFGIFTEFTDELLDGIIEYEATYEQPMGSFFSIGLETINNYLIDEIFTNHLHNRDQEVIQYSLA